MVQTHVGFSVNSHFFWPHQRIHYSLSYPLEKKMQCVCEHYKTSFYPSFLFFSSCHLFKNTLQMCC